MDVICGLKTASNWYQTIHFFNVRFSFSAVRFKPRSYAALMYEERRVEMFVRGSNVVVTSVGTYILCVGSWSTCVRRSGGDEAGAAGVRRAR